jgi:transcriptional regulator with XRE-family HTH domain
VSPFGETVLAWRLARGLTQASLAVAARIPRPNLSAIERGNREVTLKTLRALAVALDLRPGVLADGVLPGGDVDNMGRAELERVARAAVSGRALPSANEAALAQALGRSARAHLTVGKGRGGTSRLAAGDRAYFLLRTKTTAPTLASLVDRLHDERRRT